MSLFIKAFSTNSEYEQYINGSGAILPNVSLTVDNNTVHYNPSSPVPPTPQTVTLTCVYVPTGGDPGSGSGSGSGGNSTKLFNSDFADSIESMTIDGNEQSSIVNKYDFGDTSEHTVVLTLKNSVTSIDDYAFSGCTRLTSVTMGSGVTSIGDSAFNSCSGLTSCTIGSSVTSIGWDVFNRCESLTSITIPDSVTIISGNAFAYCTGLTSITVEATTPPELSESAFYSVGENGTLTVPSGSIGYCDWTLTNLLPGSWTIEGVTCGGSGSGSGNGSGV